MKNESTQGEWKKLTTRERMKMSLQWMWAYLEWFDVNQAADAFLDSLTEFVDNRIKDAMRKRRTGRVKKLAKRLNELWEKCCRARKESDTQAYHLMLGRARELSFRLDVEYLADSLPKGASTTIEDVKSAWLEVVPVENTTEDTNDAD